MPWSCIIEQSDNLSGALRAFYESAAGAHLKNFPALLRKSIYESRRVKAE